MNPELQNFIDNNWKVIAIVVQVIFVIIVFELWRFIKWSIRQLVKGIKKLFKKKGDNLQEESKEIPLFNTRDKDNQGVESDLIRDKVPPVETKLKPNSEGYLDLSKR